MTFSRGFRVVRMLRGLETLVGRRDDELRSVGDMRGVKTLSFFRMFTADNDISLSSRVGEPSVYAVCSFKQ